MFFSRELFNELNRKNFFEVLIGVGLSFFSRLLDLLHDSDRVDIHLQHVLGSYHLRYCGKIFAKLSKGFSEVLLFFGRPVDKRPVWSSFRNLFVLLLLKFR